VYIKKINHLPNAETVNQIAYGASQKQRKANILQP
jgi:hypothetical protein